MSLLNVQNLVKSFGGITAVKDVSLTVQEGSLTSIIGPNGAGKTTFFNLLTGIYKPSSGDVRFAGKSIVGLRPDQVNAAGISRTFQNIRLFPGMTVIENIMVGQHPRLDLNLFGTLFRTPSFRAQEAATLKRAWEMLEFVGLKHKANELARNLPYGDQRRVEIARALAGSPRLILLDEPTAGMNPQESAEAMALFRQLRDAFKVTVVLIEHDMKVVMGISEYINVLDYGEKIAEGTPDEVRSNERVIEAYLGRRHAKEESAS